MDGLDAPSGGTGPLEVDGLDAPSGRTGPLEVDGLQLFLTSVCPGKKYPVYIENLLAQAPVKTNNPFTQTTLWVPISLTTSTTVCHPLLMSNSLFAQTFKSIPMVFELTGFHCRSLQLSRIPQWKRLKT